LTISAHTMCHCKSLRNADARLICRRKSVKRLFQWELVFLSEPKCIVLFTLALPCKLKSSKPNNTFLTCASEKWLVELIGLYHSTFKGQMPPNANALFGLTSLGKRVHKQNPPALFFKDMDCISEFKLVQNYC
jgi:hypothetical protein